MKPIYYIGMVLILSVVGSSIVADTSYGSEDVTAELRSIRQLREDINLCNLLNGIYLSKEQMEKILEIAKEAQKIRQTYLEKSKIELQETRKAFESLRKEVVKGTGINPQIGQRASSLNKKTKELKEALNEKLQELEQRVGAILTAGQKQILLEFKPCLLPPRKLNEPERAGQAFDSGPAVRMLQRLREFPPRRYAMMRDRAINRYLYNLKEHHYIELTPEERRQEYRRLVTLCDRVRRMNEVDFELQKEQLAEEFARPILERDEQFLKNQHLYGKNKALGKIGRYFLDPRIIPILEEKIALADTYKKQEEANLLKVEPAEPGNSSGLSPKGQ